MQCYLSTMLFITLENFTSPTDIDETRLVFRSATMASHIPGDGDPSDSPLIRVAKQDPHVPLSDSLRRLSAVEGEVPSLSAADPSCSAAGNISTTPAPASPTDSGSHINPSFVDGDASADVPVTPVGLAGKYVSLLTARTIVALAEQGLSPAVNVHFNELRTGGSRAALAMSIAKHGTPPRNCERLPYASDNAPGSSSTSTISTNYEAARISSVLPQLNALPQTPAAAAALAAVAAAAAARTHGSRTHAHAHMHGLPPRPYTSAAPRASAPAPAAASPGTRQPVWSPHSTPPAAQQLQLHVSS